jgi:hypothetical protein
VIAHRAFVLRRPGHREAGTERAIEVDRAYAGNGDDQRDGGDDADDEAAPDEAGSDDNTLQKRTRTLTDPEPRDNGAAPFFHSVKDDS